MNSGIGAIVIVAACFAVLIIGAMRKKAEFIFNIILRAVFGTIGIYFINQALAAWGFSALVGINAWTVLTSGILGFPGLLLLYGINFYSLL